jgi:ubiquinone/menaquinone biosynthesis C-methylase UbiE
LTTLEKGLPLNGTKDKFLFRPSVHDHVQRFILRLSKLHKPALTDDHALFYSQFFEEKNLDEATYDLRLSLRREVVRDAIVALSLHHVRADRPPLIVDLGCGVGDILMTLPKEYLRIGISYSLNDLLLAKTNCDASVQFLKGSAFELALREDSADVVILLEVLEHLENERAALNEIARVLRPQGFLVISVPNTHYFPDYLRLIGHYRHYTLTSLSRSLADAGFTAVRYLEQWPRVQFLHYYPYVLLVALHRLLNCCGLGNASVYRRPVLGWVYSNLSHFIQRRVHPRGQVELAEDEGTTFLVAQKKVE